jgi:hypothetical protein
VESEFTAGQVSSDGGVLLLRKVDCKINLLGRLSNCLTDGRSPLLVTHPFSEMLAQRIYGLALGYEDLNDHEQLRSDPLLGVLSGKPNLEEPLAGESTLNRLELDFQPLWTIAFHGARHIMCFYEKVIKVKADVTALLDFSSDVGIDVRW